MDTSLPSFSRDTIGSDPRLFWVLSPCLPDISFYWLKRWYPQFKRHCLTNITMNIIKNRGKDTFHNVITNKSRPFLVRILVENFATQKIDTMRKETFPICISLVLLCGSSAACARLQADILRLFQESGVDIMAFWWYLSRRTPEGTYHHERTPCGDEWRYPSGSHTRTMAARTETAQTEAGRTTASPPRCAILTLTLSHRFNPDDLPGPPPYIYGKRGKQK